MVGLLPFQGTILKTPGILFLPTEQDFPPGQTVYEYQRLWRTFEEVILNDSPLTSLNQEKIFLPKDVFTKRIDRLSSGMQQRVKLWRLGDTRAVLWILDEPWQHLDREAAGVLDNCIMAHLKRGGAVIFTSHDQRVFSFETASVDLTALESSVLVEDAWPF
jgi:ABC-type transport system involved in cytochrome c biogenesis ATPase subunit